jgi:toxin ParE1/3/4
LIEIVWTVPARDNLAAIQTYIEQFNPRAAQAVAAELLAAAESLVTLPNRGRPVPRTQMRDLVTTYPYIIRYQVIGEDVVILRIRHTSRRPTSP